MQYTLNDFKCELRRSIGKGSKDLMGKELHHIFVNGTNEEAKKIHDLCLMKKEILKSTKLELPEWFIGDKL